MYYVAREDRYAHIAMYIRKKKFCFAKHYQEQRILHAKELHNNRDVTYFSIHSLLAN